MGPHPDRQEQRQAYRYPATGRRGAELVVDGNTAPVRMENVSANGFAVSADRCLDLRPGQVGQLRTADAWFEVRIVRVARLAGGALCRIGLQRLRDLPVPSQEKAVRGAWFAALLGGVKIPPTGVAAAIAFLVALLAAAGPIALAVWSWRSDHPAVRWLSRLAADDDAARPVDRARIPAKPSPLPVARSDLNDAGAAPDLRPGAALPSTIRRLPGAGVFVLPDVARELELTDEQRARIKEIVEATEIALSKLNPTTRQWSRQRESAEHQKTLDAARQQALAVLSPDQRRRWESFVEADER